MNQIKKILFIVFISGVVCYPQNFWERIDSPTTQDLNAVVFVDSLIGWISSDSGKIFYTSDGGETWSEQFSNDSLRIVDLFFLDNNFGWGSALSAYYEPYGTFLLRTTNGGMNWNSEYVRIGEVFVNSFYFRDIQTGFAAGLPRVFHKTNDGGLTWNAVNLDSSIVSGFPAYRIKFYSSLYGFACGGLWDSFGVVWRTTDGGDNWSTVVSNLTAEPLFDIQFFDSLNVLIVGGDPTWGSIQVLTTDGGNTWEYKSLGGFGYPVDVGFRTATEGWMPISYIRKFFFTSDFGNNWTEIDTPDSTMISHICFTDSAHGFGIGPYGTIVKYVYQEPSNLTEPEYSYSNFNLQQNYPNPFNPSTTIKYSIPEDGYVKLAIYNMLGEEVAMLVNTEQKAGKYEVNFSAKGGSASGGNAYNLSSGVYVYRLETANFVTSKKLMLMK